MIVKGLIYIFVEGESEVDGEDLKKRTCAPRMQSATTSEPPHEKTDQPPAAIILKEAGSKFGSPIHSRCIS